MSLIKVTGVLDHYFETGCEGTYWTLNLDDEIGIAQQPYERLFMLEKGDVLEIFSPTGVPIATVTVDPDYEAGYRPYPLNPEYGQPTALGLWIHWTQRGWNPDEWARLFIPEIPDQEYNRRLIETLARHNALDLLTRYGSSRRIQLPDPDFDRFCELKWLTASTFKNRGIVTRQYSAELEPPHIQAEHRQLYRLTMVAVFEEADKANLLEGPIESNSAYFERNRLRQEAVQRFRASVKQLEEK
jgi:hypothetical protein